MSCKPHEIHQISEADRQRANELLADHQIALGAAGAIAATIEGLERQRDLLEAYHRRKMKEVEALLLHPAYRRS